MGCCLTTAFTAAEDSKPRDAPPPPPLHPPLLFEEESVKRVLSETPVIPKLSPPSDSTTTNITGNTQPSLLRSEEEFRSGHVIVQSTKNPIQENESEVSSGMYTYSASFSATTTTIGDGIDEDGEVTQKVNKPSPSTKLMRRRQQTTFSRDRAGNRVRGVRQPSPAKRSAAPCSDKKPQVPSRNPTTAGHQRNVVPSNIIRRESPARRSRSPPMRVEAGQLRKVKERSPVRQAANLVPVTVTGKTGNVVLKKPNDGAVVPEPEPEPATGESLENPLVSLECFIFL